MATSEAAHRPNQRTRSIRNWNGPSGVMASRRRPVLLTNLAVGSAAGVGAGNASKRGPAFGLCASSTLQR